MRIIVVYLLCNICQIIIWNKSNIFTNIFVNNSHHKTEILAKLRVYWIYLPALVTIISVPSSLNSSHRCFISNAAPTPESFGCSWLLGTTSNLFLSDDKYVWWEVDLMACIFVLDTVSKHAIYKKKKKLNKFRNNFLQRWSIYLYCFIYFIRGPWLKIKNICIYNFNSIVHRIR